MATALIRDRRFQIIKADAEKRLVYGVVYAPEEVDSQGDYATAKEIEKAAHSFLLNGGVIGLEHQQDAPARAVESFIAPDDMKIGETDVDKGSWVLVTKVFDDAVWELVKSGKLTGYSMAGKAKVAA